MWKKNKFSNEIGNLSAMQVMCLIDQTTKFVPSRSNIATLYNFFSYNPKWTPTTVKRFEFTFHLGSMRKYRFHIFIVSVSKYTTSDVFNQNVLKTVWALDQQTHP
jgi:hypothetical protein